MTDSQAQPVPAADAQEAQSKPLSDEAKAFVISDETIEYYRNAAKACPGGLSCRGWSCIPLVGLIGVIDALRSTLARLTDDPTSFNTIALRNELQPFLNEWLKKANAESKRHGFAESYRYDSNDRWLLDHILIALSRHIKAAAKAAQKAHA